MKSNSKVKIEANKSDKTEYLIKDKDCITIGRFKILEMDEASKRCDIKLRFYREKESELLSETLISMLKAIFNNNNIYKVNIKVAENINISSFLNLGFTLEGILSENEYVKGDYIDELLLGITRIDYNQNFQFINVELKGKNVVLRSLTPGNAEDVLEYYIRNKKHLEAFEPSRDKDFYTIETQRNILNESYKQFLNGTNVELGIFKDEKFIGKIKLSNIVYGVFKSGILGYSIDKDEQGKGYMKESVKLMIDYAFSECELHRIEASALVDNEKSIGVLKACRFKMLGINENYLLINGKWRDHITYYTIKDM